LFELQVIVGGAHFRARGRVAHTETAHRRNHVIAHLEIRLGKAQVVVRRQVQRRHVGAQELHVVLVVGEIAFHDLDPRARSMS
jgi:hypothetical protein